MLTTKVTIAALLHDIGKIVQRTAIQDGRAHPVCGKDFMQIFTDDIDILQAIEYHHKDKLSKAKIANDAIAYITYIADNIAAGADRRDNIEQDESGATFKRNLPLSSIFNLLNNRNDNKKHSLQDIEKLNLPTEDITVNSSDYNILYQRIKDSLQSIQFTDDYVNSLLEIMEGTLSYVPSSTNTNQVSDISLYDHSKITAAVASCIYKYLYEQKRDNYKDILLDNEKDFYSENAFLMFSCDISGIQKFIYTISSDNALKALRSRSFYLEIFMENNISQLLDCCGLSRANIIYSGGGHCYILLPNTDETKELLNNFSLSINHWLLEHFKTLLYVATGYTECSANDLMNKGNNENSSPYKNIFIRLSKSLSISKIKRYTAENIRELNIPHTDAHERECKVCGSIDRLSNYTDICSLCKNLIDISSELVKEDNVIVISKEKFDGVVSLELPALKSGSVFMNCVSVEKSIYYQKHYGEKILSVYGINKMYTGLNYFSKLWMGTYHDVDKNKNMATFEDLANDSEGIHRLAVLRADVDFLGKAFIEGFERKNDKDRYRYVTLSRYATLSRQLSIFFKKHINEILSDKFPEERFSLTTKKTKNKKVTIVYSGGDDLFIVGAWNEVIETAIDFYNTFKVYTGGALSFSAGLGIFESKYPISRMAQVAAELEATAKGIDDNKNAICLFDSGETFGSSNSNITLRHNYKWEVFINEVIGVKFREIQSYFSLNKDIESAKGNSFLYKLMDYTVFADDKINIARCAYLLGRMAPGDNANQEVKTAYSIFSQNMYKWILNKTDREQLLTAINIYVYITRKEGEE